MLCDKSLCYFPGRNSGRRLFKFAPRPNIARIGDESTRARERGLKYVPHAAAAMRVCVVFGEIDIFFLLLFSRSRVSAGIQSQNSSGKGQRNFTSEAAGSVITPASM